MTKLLLPVPPPFHFRDVVFSHGWLRLRPFDWNDEAQSLSRVEGLPSGPARFTLTAAPEGVWVETDAAEADLPELERRVRWMLALEDDLSPFHALCATEPGLREAAARGKGRVLRCPTVWEDLVKTLFSVNTTWKQTISMTEKLVELCGPETPHGRAFPRPEDVAARTPEELQQVCRVGYRALPLWQVAQALADGTLDLEALKDPALPTEEVEARLRSLRGIGPYAAANVLLLLGRYDHLPVDSWFRATVKKGWFSDAETPDRELVAAFERFRPYRTLVYYFFDWDGANRPEVWVTPLPDEGN